MFAARETLFATVLAPLAVAALMLFAVPYWITAYMARWFTREPDVAATAKVVGGFLIYTAWLLVLTAAAAFAVSLRAALLMLMFLPILAIAGLFAIERELAVIDTVRAWFLLTRTQPDTRERLRRYAIPVERDVLPREEPLAGDGERGSDPKCARRDRAGR